MGFSDLLAILLFVVVAPACLVGGAYLILQRLGDNRRFVLVVLAAWYGLTLAWLTLANMLLDPHSAFLASTHVLEMSVLFGLAAFMAVMVLAPLSMALLRLFRLSLGLSKPSRHKWL